MTSAVGDWNGTGISKAPDFLPPLVYFACSGRVAGQVDVLPLEESCGRVIGRNSPSPMGARNAGCDRTITTPQQHESWERGLCPSRAVDRRAGGFGQPLSRPPAAAFEKIPGMIPMPLPLRRSGTRHSPAARLPRRPWRCGDRRTNPAPPRETSAGRG